MSTEWSRRELCKPLWNPTEEKGGVINEANKKSIINVSHWTFSYTSNLVLGHLVCMYEHWPGGSRWSLICTWSSMTLPTSTSIPSLFLSGNSTSLAGLLLHTGGSTELNLGSRKSRGLLPPLPWIFFKAKKTGICSLSRVLSAGISLGRTIPQRWAQRWTAAKRNCRAGPRLLLLLLQGLEAGQEGPGSLCLWLC